MNLLQQRKLYWQIDWASKAQGALVRSRFQNVTQMDAPSKFSLAWKKKTVKGEIIHSLVSDTGQELNKTSEIRQAVVEFYKQLYTADLINGKILNTSRFFKDCQFLMKKVMKI